MAQISVPVGAKKLGIDTSKVTIKDTWISKLAPGDHPCETLCD